jgi:HEPN domain-containing protein
MDGGSMSPHDYALILVKKALEDLYTIEKLLPDPAAPDTVIGFHAQKAVEKLLKAVLTQHGIEYRWTHDLVELLDACETAEIAVPDEAGSLHLLIPFAAMLRYDDIDLSEEPLDRTWAHSCVIAVRAWAERQIT